MGHEGQQANTEGTASEDRNMTRRGIPPLVASHVAPEQSKTNREGVVLKTVENGWGGVETTPVASKHVEKCVETTCVTSKHVGSVWGGVETTCVTSKHVGSVWGGVETTPFMSTTVENRVMSKPPPSRRNTSETGGVVSKPTPVALKHIGNRWGGAETNPVAPKHGEKE